MYLRHRQQLSRYDNEIQFREYMATERDQEARDIEQGVADLAAIFDNFKSAVDAQQDYVGMFAAAAVTAPSPSRLFIRSHVYLVIDSIENNIIQSVENTRQGVATLTAAKGYQESSRSKLYCVALIAIIILAILVALAALGVTIKYAF